MLQNNSSDMATIVETYLVEETLSLIYDNEQLDKWNGLVSQLGLEGQTKITTKEKSPVPFMYMKKPLVNVFACLCPKRMAVSKFDLSPIPVEILDLVALSVKEEYFSRIEIWADDRQPDPACIGVIEHHIIHKKGSYRIVEDTPVFRTKAECERYISDHGINGESYNYSSEAKYYLIGRWADMKRTIAELTEMAKARFMALEGVAIRKKIKDYTRELDDLEINAIQKFGYEGASVDLSVGNFDLPF